MGRVNAGHSVEKDEGVHLQYVCMVILPFWNSIGQNNLHLSSIY